MHMFNTQDSTNDSIELANSTLKKIEKRKIEIPFPKKLPGTFQELAKYTTPLGKVYQGCKSGFNLSSVLTVIASACIEEDDYIWYHVSVARKNGITPTYDDLQYIKKYWIGDERWCIQVFPEKEEHVNLVNALHLWHCLETNPLPDFRKFGMI